MVIILMGVSGSGKTTLGQKLGKDLQWKFLDSDSFHSPENIEKMKSGLPLTDQDRAPWLQNISQVIRVHIKGGLGCIIACSALKSNYRVTLKQGQRDVKFIFLKASAELLEQRLKTRTGHFMPASLLESQLAALEEPSASEALILNMAKPIEENVEIIKENLQK